MNYSPSPEEWVLLLGVLGLLTLTVLVWQEPRGKP